jgi:hypothetical protein
MCGYVSFEREGSLEMGELRFTELLTGKQVVERTKNCPADDLTWLF